MVTARVASVLHAGYDRSNSGDVDLAHPPRFQEWKNMHPQQGLRCAPTAREALNVWKILAEDE
jgi:hypothetical protein